MAPRQLPRTHQNAEQIESQPALIIGCGYLGSRVAAAWRGAGRSVAALTRHRAAQLAELGLEPIVGDVLDLASLQALPAAATVLYAVGLDRSAGRSMRDVYVGGLTNVLAVLPASCRIIYISSTSVYGQTDGSVVDESSRTDPLEESGKVVLEAEQTLRAKRPDAVVLRFAGIYGPDRLLRKVPLLAGQPLIGDADKWLNLIHVDDGSRAIQRAELFAPPGSTFNIADGSPVSRRQFYTRLAELLSAPPAIFTPVPADLPPIVEANRRISAARAQRDLGFVPEFPSYIEGLADAVRASAR